MTNIYADLPALREEIEKSVENRKFYLIVKRIFDIFASLTALIVLSPVFLIVAAAIFIDNPHGSPIFVQERVGINGKKFKFYKFRSMIVNAEKLKMSLQDRNEKSGPVFKIRDDPRITRVGKFIRKTSIDELPQLVNVLRGDMSLVGPRPPLPDEVAKYNEYHKLRLKVTPGLTCYWQVIPGRDSIPFEEWVDLDIKYIKDRSFWTDIKLILKTVIVSFTGQGT